MDMSDIELVRTLVRVGSLSEASAQLNQSQPTLSRKLSRLEDRLRVTLFHRTPKGLAPTELAHYILSKAEPLDHKLREIERHMELVSDLGVGTLKLGVGPIIEQTLLPGVLTRFVETTGEVRLSIVTEDASTLLKLFHASELDVIVGPFRASDYMNKSFVTIPMVKDDIIAVARPAHPIFDLESVDAEALAQFAWAAPKKQGSAKLAKGARVLPSPKIHSDNYDLHKRLMLSSDVLCAAPRAVFREEIDDGVLKQVGVEIGLIWESALVTRSETMLAPLARHLVALFEEENQGLNVA